MTIGRIAAPLTELNFDLVWSQVPGDAKKAFRGIPAKVRLPSGFKLYKFTEFDLANRHGRITEWWSPVDPYGLDPGYTARLHLALHLGVPPAELVRVVAAVKENWNALTHVLQARLLQPVYGFWGQCAMQARKDMLRAPRPGIGAPPPREDMPKVRTDHLPGYAWQFYIPRLTPAHIQATGRLPIPQ